MPVVNSNYMNSHLPFSLKDNYKDLWLHISPALGKLVQFQCYSQPSCGSGDEISKMLLFFFTFFQPCFLWFLHYITELGACYKKAKTLSCSYEKTLECDFSWCRNWSYYAINWVNRVPHKLVWKWNCPPREFYMKINLKSIKSQHAAP